MRVVGDGWTPRIDRFVPRSPASLSGLLGLRRALLGSTSHGRGLSTSSTEFYSRSIFLFGRFHILYDAERSASNPSFRCTNFTSVDVYSKRRIHRPAPRLRNQQVCASRSQRLPLPKGFLSRCSIPVPE